MSPDRLAVFCSDLKGLPQTGLSAMPLFGTVKIIPFESPTLKE
jgi:hypothetical protein